jgi:membrane-bound lytic murein transglycosylase B
VRFWEKSNHPVRLRFATARHPATLGGELEDKMKIYKAVLSVVLGTFILPVLAEGEDFDPNRWNQTLHDVQAFAVKSKISPAVINSVIQNANFVPEVIQRDRNQPEFKLTADEYLNRMINDKRVSLGKKMMREHITILDKVEEKYSIPRQLIIAFWGMESNYGDYKASFDLTDAFLSLIYDGRRGGFFRDQLISLMKTAEKSRLDVRKIRGSWAGAMGHFQFMPSTLEQYGVDGNADGKIDIINNKADAIMSAANFLNKLKFDKSSRVVREIKLPRGFDFESAGVKNKKSVDAWSAAGVRGVDGSPLPKSDMSAGIFAPDGASGRAWLTYDNFDRIKRWNNSNNYALAVAILMERLR